jgi:Arc/MetJ-type ribon-helix-helix transcriptional regulator
MTSQIAVKLPDELLEAVDHLVASNRFANRSEIVRAGLQRIIADDASRTIDRAFADGFARHPDSDDDVHRTTRLAIESIDEEPWEKWW